MLVLVLGLLLQLLQLLLHLLLHLVVQRMLLLLLLLLLRLRLRPARHRALDAWGTVHRGSCTQACGVSYGVHCLGLRVLLNLLLKARGEPLVRLLLLLGGAQAAGHGPCSVGRAGTPKGVEGTQRGMAAKGSGPWLRAHPVAHQDQLAGGGRALTQSLGAEASSSHCWPWPRDVRQATEDNSGSNKQ